MPEFLSVIIIGLAFAGLLFVILEDVIHVNKAQTVLFFGTLAWILLFVFSGHEARHDSVIEGLYENIAEIAGLWLFLLAAMTFVVYLNKKGLIESLIYRFLPQQISERKLLFFIAIFAFVFSSLADNITATLVSIALILSLKLDASKTIRFATVVVFSVNSGGVAMITGDVTTLMIFLQGKASIPNLLLLSLPAFTAVIVLAGLLSYSLKDMVTIEIKKESHEPVDAAIAIVFVLTIFSTIASNILFDIPPVLTFLFGLSVMFLLARAYGEDTHNHPILNYIRQIEFDTLLFFLGILLLVGALKEIHALQSFVHIYDVLPIWLANYVMGILSAVIDNVPLTAALLKSNVVMNAQQWLSLTYAVGVGGSMLIIGSAAGIVAMSKIEALTFMSYFKYFILLFFAYTLGYGATILMGTLL
ncbi:MAG: Na+/H+ antiporter NhaD/arsenite permease-like protein [Oceanicoccus sp.]|jgi:Na+/H+ antiporter NhaD/arsenite permease-like protein